MIRRPPRSPPIKSSAASDVYKRQWYLRVAADFVAPAYIPYVQFVIEEAKRKGIKKLYFLNRDSYI